jgi:hypothetical protein
MNRGLWLASAGLVLGVGLVASGCYVRPFGPPVVVSAPIYAEPPPPQYAPPPPQYAPPPPAYEPPPPPQPAPVADATLYPTTPPPDPIPEYQPPAPGYGYYWAAGYWDWTGYDWSWNAGFWAPQRPGYVYFGPRFVFVDGQPVYYRAYWQGPGGYREYGYGYGGRPVPEAWRARPSVEPRAWRTNEVHNNGWRNNPGATTWRGAPPRGEMRGEPGRRVEAGRAEPGRPMGPGRPMEPGRAEPGRPMEPGRTEPARGEPMHGGAPPPGGFHGGASPMAPAGRPGGAPPPPAMRGGPPPAMHAAPPAPRPPAPAGGGAGPHKKK